MAQKKKKKPSADDGSPHSLRSVADLADALARHCTLRVRGSAPAAAPPSPTPAAAELADDANDHQQQPSPSTSPQQQQQPAAGGGPRLGLTCGTCGLVFATVEEQRAHFASDLHRYNVKRALAGRPSLEADVLEAIIKAGDDLSSISGSDSEEVEDDGARPGRRRGDAMIAFEITNSSTPATSRASSTFAYPRGLLGDCDDDDNDALASSLVAIATSPGPWVVIMASGGHFASAVYPSASSDAPIAHRTFHRYVVRAKTGGRQSAKDATGKHAHSAGASLRRHNEAALSHSIRDLLGVVWQKHLEDASLVFWHAPGPHNQRALFRGEGAPLTRGDPRLRPIPFATRRPTLKEVARVKHRLGLLSTIAPEEEGKKAKPRGREEAEAGAGAGEEATAEVEGPSTERPADPQPEPASASEEDASNPFEETALHAAARAGDAARVASMLEGGADPTACDLRGRPPYLVARTKDVRDAFRRFRHTAGEDAFDWQRAQVPQALSPELEQQQREKRAAKERKRKQEKAKRQAKKAAETAREAEAEAEAERKGKGKGKGKASEIVRHNVPTPAPLDIWTGQKDKQRAVMAAAAERRIRQMVSARSAKPTR